MGQRELTLDEVKEVVGRIHYEKNFRVGEHAEGVWFVQIEYEEPDIRDGSMTLQRGRKWYVSRFATDSEIVQTCLRAALDSAEHQVREHFGYLAQDSTRVPRLIYGPHFDADFLYDAMADAGSGAYDAREDPE